MKRWKRSFMIVFFVTALFFIFTAFMFYFYVREIDNNYSRLLSVQMDNSRNFQHISSRSLKNYFFLYETLHTDNIQTIDSLQNAWRASTLQNTNNLLKFSGTGAMEDTIYKNLIKTRAGYLNTCEKFFRINKEQNKDRRNAFFINTVNPEFVIYQQQLEYVIEYQMAAIKNHSETISADINKDSFKLMIFGFSPLIISSVLMFGFVLFILGIMIYLFVFKPIPA